jgi:ABC-type multidrug transport system ATPase subunit
MLRLENVSYIVGDDLGEKGILKNVTVDIDARFVAITGPNGGGKSTLAKIIAGIVKPTSGKIYYDGVDITDDVAVVYFDIYYEGAERSELGTIRLYHEESRAEYRELTKKEQSVLEGSK